MPLIFKEQPFPGSLLGIWHITETSGELEQSCTLSGEDRAQVDSFRNDLRKRQWLACRKILEELGVPSPRVRYNPAGKPFLEDSTASVSFSHSGNYAAALFAVGFRVGIDIEVPRDRIARVADRFLHPDESVRTVEPNRLEKLYIYWCAKEGTQSGGTQSDSGFALRITLLLSDLRQ